LLFVQIQNFNPFPLGHDSTSERLILLRVKMSMKRTTLIGLAWILLASGISILWGTSLAQKANGWWDFKAIYYGTRCLLEHHNPYRQSELEAVYRVEGGESPSEPIPAHQAVTLYVNLPTTFIVIAPFAMLPWGPAHVLWMTLIAGGYILAALLMWNLGASYAPNLSLFLICILLTNCEMVFFGGNAAGIVTNLCVVAVWCFLRERFVLAGVLCLAISLALKPHDAGFVWLYFLLAGGVYRKRALQTLLITAVLGLAAFLWVSHVAPHWMQDWNSNMSAISAHGGINEAGPNSITSHEPGIVLDLQAAISIFRDDPRIYNPVSYLVCGALLLLWSVRTLRSRFSLRSVWLGLAVAATLTMLVTYHRPWDAKLLLLTVPACALLWAEGGPIRWIALVVNAAGLLSTADIPLVFLSIYTKGLHPGAAGILGKMLAVVQLRPTPLILLAMGIFYMWIYLRGDPARDATAGLGEPKETPPALTRA
jgi:hypothetical protein